MPSSALIPFSQTQPLESDMLRFILSLRCTLHQVALVRKLVPQRFDEHFSNIVRLAHLFELHSFRQDFKTALVRVVLDNFKFVEVPELPPESELWRVERRAAASLLENQAKYSRTRRSLHELLLTWDNGNCSLDSIVHYCTGNCCVGACASEREEYANLQVCKLLYLLFGKGYPVPLLYRWLHVQRALRFPIYKPL